MASSSAALLDEQVRQRPAEREHALKLLNRSIDLLAAAHRTDEAAQKNLAKAIQTMQQGFAPFQVDEKPVTCNSRFGKPLRDLQGAFVPVLSLTDHVDLVSHSRHLALPVGETPASWARRHADHSVVVKVELYLDG